MSFPRYPKYKDSGVEWLGVVPEHWDVMPIRFAARLESGHTPSRNHPEYWENCTIPWFSLADIWQVRQEARSVIHETKEMISELGIQNSAARRLPPGTVMLSRTASVGFAAIMGVEMATTQDFANWVCGERLKPEFLLNTFRAMRGEFGRLMMGSTHNTIYMPDIQAFRFALPPLAEQTAIAAFLDRETAKIDALVAEQERLIELLKEKRQAVISHAVTKGLNPKVPMKDSGVEWLGEIPAHWDVVSARRMFRVRSEPAQDGDQQLTASQKYGMILQSEFVELEGRRVVEVIKGRESLLHVEPDDFVISMRSFQGGLEWCRVRGSTSFHYVMVTPVKHVHPPFFALLFKSSAYIQALRTTTDLIRDGQELRYSNFVRVDLPVIPLDEQAKIVELVGPEISRIDALTAEAQRAVDLLQERRTALISAAVTGQIDVRDDSARPRADRRSTSRPPRGSAIGAAGLE